MTTEYTKNFRLNLPDFRMGPWHDLTNGNTVSIDQLLLNIAQGTDTTNWVNSTFYELGETAIDTSDYSFWMCRVSHTSANAPTTFAQDRIAHPSYWLRTVVGINPRGDWVNSAHYYVNDLVTDQGEGVIALCKTEHISSAPPSTIRTDIAYWSILADLATGVGGPPGPTGPVGPAGPQGPQGVPGTSGTGSGDVTGPTSAVNNRIAMFNGTTGKLIADSGKVTTDFATQVAVDAKVNKSGDIMSGPLTVNSEIAAKNSTNDSQVFLTAGFGSYGSISAGNAAGNLVKNLVINQFGGNVGIGTNAPGQRLDVNGNIRAGAGVFYTDASVNSNCAYVFRDSNAVEKGYILWDHNGGSISLNNSTGGGLVAVGINGNVGIGTLTPGYKLDVSGAIHSTGDHYSETAIISRSTSNDAAIVLHTDSGSYGSISAVNYARNALKDLVINQYGGNVGIGTNTLTDKLNVAGNVSIAGNVNITQGSITITQVGAAWPGITLSSQNPDTEHRITALRGGKNFWIVSLIDGGAAGDFYIHRYNDAGNWNGTPIIIRRATGKVELGGNVDIAGNLAVNGTIASGGQLIGGRALIATLTASNSVNLTDITSLTATYPMYEIVFENVLPVTDNAHLMTRVRSGGSFQATSYGYVAPVFFINIGNGTCQLGGSANANTATQINLAENVGNVAGNGVNGSLRIQKPATAGIRKPVYGQLAFKSGGTGNWCTINPTGVWEGGTGIVDGIQFYFSAGNIASGTVKIYGIV